MASKIYSDRSNCYRNARSVLGKDAKTGVDFTIAGDKASGFYWEKIEAEQPVAAEAPEAAEAPSVKELVKAALSKGADESLVQDTLATISFGDQDEAPAAIRFLFSLAEEEVVSPVSVACEVRELAKKTGWVSSLIGPAQMPAKQRTGKRVKAVAPAKPATPAKAEEPVEGAPVTAPWGMRLKGEYADQYRAALEGILPDRPEHRLVVFRDLEAVSALIDKGDVAGVEAYPIDPLKGSKHWALYRHVQIALVALKSGKRKTSPRRVHRPELSPAAAAAA